MRVLALHAIICTGQVLASTAVQMDVAALTTASTDVVDARVVSATPEWTGDHRRIVTRVVIDVGEAWKGAASGQLVVVQPGGERDGLAQSVAGVAWLSPGERVVLFLERSGPVHRVVGIAQGVYRVPPAARGAELRAVPAAIDDLGLVTPPGRQPAARVPLTLTALKASVQAAAR